MELFVGTLPPDVTGNALRTLFQPYRRHTSVRVEVKRFTDGSEARFGVVGFDSDRLARQAMRQLDGKVVNGAPVRVRRFCHRGNDGQPPGHNGDRRRQEVGSEGDQ